MPKTDDKEHLKILSPTEVEALYGLRRFTQDEQEQYFATTGNYALGILHMIFMG